MAEFIDIILQVIYEYKKILKRHLQAKEYIEKIKMLGVNRTNLRSFDEQDLFKIAKIILDDLNNHGNSNKQSRLFSGVSEFREHLNKILNTYRLEQGKVINAAQEASNAFVSTVQLISLSKGIDITNSLQKIMPHIKKIIYYGTTEQIQSAINILRQNGSQKKDLCYPLLRMLETQLQNKLSK